MRGITAILHPHKGPREKGRIAEERIHHANCVAEQQRVTLARAKEQTNNAITLAATTAIEQLNARYASEISDANNKYALAETEYHAALSNLAQEFFNVSCAINRRNAPDKPQIQIKLQDSYKIAAEKINAQHHDDENMHGVFVFSTKMLRETKIDEIRFAAIAEREKIEQEYQNCITDINAKLSNILCDVRQVYFNDLAQLRRQYRATVINAYTAVLGGIATIASFGGFGPINAAWQASMQASCALTTIGAAERAIKGNEAVGGNINTNFSFAGTSRTPAPNFNTTNRASNNTNSQSTTVIADAQREFRQIAQAAHNYYTQPESISLYPRQGVRSNYSFAFQVQLSLQLDNSLRVRQLGFSFKPNNQSGMQRFILAIDPDLKRNSHDSVLMAELKMYGRMAKNTRDAVVYMVTDPIATVREGFTLGADLIEAGLHALGKDYYPAAQQRNQARLAAWDNFRKADSLAQREAIGTLALQTLLLAPTGGMLVEAGVNGFGMVNRAASNVAGAVARTSDRLPITFQFEAGRLYSGFPVDAVKVKHNIKKVSDSFTLYSKTNELVRTHAISGKSSSKKVKKLEENIRMNGFDVNQPIEVVKHDGKLYVVDGHHRLKAAKMAGINDIPVRFIANLSVHHSNWNSIGEILKDANNCGLDNLKLR